MTSDYNETDRPTTPEYIDPNATGRDRTYDRGPDPLEPPTDVTVDPTQDVRREDSGLSGDDAAYGRSAGLDERGVVVDPEDQYDPGPSLGEPVPPVEPRGDFDTAVRADPGPPAAARGSYDEDEVKANPGAPAAARGYYDENEVKANPGPPAAAGDYYDDDSQVKGNLGPPPGTVDADPDVTQRRALRDDDYYEGDTSVEGTPGRRAMSDPDLSRDRDL